MSSSSVTTSIPTGPIPEWCLMPQSERKSLFICPESGISVKQEDFISICCDGVIVDTSIDLYSSLNSSNWLFPYSVPNTNTTTPIDLSNLLCCPISGVQSQALNPIPGSSARTSCAPGTLASPLASLAATNASDADLFPVTYASVSASATVSGDLSATITNDLWGWGTPTYGASGSPMCLWANTASGVSVAEVTVPVSYVASGTTTSADSGSSSSAEPSPSSAATSSRGLRWRWGLGRVLRLLILGLLLAW
ncbi:uncharacterized protein F4807DRAFT_321980 [Annulohypoxylon truncatum]|uniref:uncharacterized protein n=1 Tax=Annulohypoxylon truncatum TaxID=327061 RepID=UPI002007F6EF|nr:uncharacterized protein F4807DRAFT_321980 [Annulohypoxylon truncatum]KAI1204752.1 hypothetical protein F4807DRAFT_321980 [Annulohypoxylon truncatum]